MHRIAMRRKGRTFLVGTWWESAREQLQRFPAETHDLIFDNITDSVMVFPDIADDFATVAESLPGWDDGPEYAQNPILRYDDEPAED